MPSGAVIACAFLLGWNTWPVLPLTRPRQRERCVPPFRRNPVKAEVPDALKADLPPSKWGKILSGTPVILAVVATMLAGLASSEMTTAQYDRSLAAQLQSKAGDQWSFFQAKRLRSALQNNTLDVLLGAGGRRSLERDALVSAVARTPAAASLDSAAGQQALTILREGVLPTLPAAAPIDANVQAALAGIESHASEPELAALMVKVDDKVLEQTVRSARDQAVALDTALKPIGLVIDQIEQEIGRQSGEVPIRRDFVAARLGYNARRYDMEARLNQTVASLYEIQVRKANLSAARHHRRSQKFFYGMLAAQAGVIVSTLAIAARKRNVLWALAAIAGAVAVVFAVYVYLYV
jgi:hypothetical protein